MHVKHILLLNHRGVPQYILQILIRNMHLSMYNVGLIAARNASVVRSFFEKYRHYITMNAVRIFLINSYRKSQRWSIIIIFKKIFIIFYSFSFSFFLLSFNHSFHKSTFDCTFGSFCIMSLLLKMHKQLYIRNKLKFAWINVTLRGVQCLFISGKSWLLNFT